LEIALPVTINPDTLPADTIDVPYNRTLTAGGGIGNKTVVVTNIQNAIPGLNVPANGTNTLVITGTPTATGTETFTVTATDPFGATTQQNYSVSVNPAIAIAPGTLAQATAGAAYNHTLTVSDGT